MQARTFLAVVAALSIGASFVAACDCSSSSEDNADGGGGKDAGPGTDAPVTPGDDGGQTTDGGTDAAVTCDKHLPSGYSEMVASDVDTQFGQYANMVLDENDDPMVAFFAVKASIDNGTVPSSCAPPGNLAGCQAVYFTRWDPCAGAFTKPLLVDPVTNIYNVDAAQHVALAYDKTTKEIGIGYQKTIPTDPNWADTFDAIFLATMKSGGSSFTVQQVSDNVRTGVTDVTTSQWPGLAMGNGKIYMAFSSSTGDPAPCPSNYTCLRFLSSTTAADPDAGNTEGGVVPHYFDYTYVPNSQGYMNFALPRGQNVSLGIDAMGRAAIAYLEAPQTGYNTGMFYWRTDMADSVKITDTNNVQNDFVTIGLAFAGNKPRVAGILTRDGSSYGVTYVSSPDDGTTWNAPAPLYTTAGAYPYSTIAANASGDVVATHYNGSVAAASLDAGCTTNPSVTRTSNNGTTFTGCDLPGGERTLAGALSSAFGTSRINGKYVLVGHTRDQFADGGAGGSNYSGLLYYQDP